jgi:multidrug efflux pump subunit AcrA (membrane-fusion protein)
MTLSALALAAAMAGGGCSPGGSAPSRAIASVRRASLVQRVTIGGYVAPYRRAVIAAPYSGYIGRIHVRTGQDVRIGDPILSIRQSLRSPASEVYPLRAPLSGKVVQVLASEGDYVEPGAGAEGKASAAGLVRIDDLGRLTVRADVPEMDIVKLQQSQEVVIRPSALPAKTYQGRIGTIAIAARDTQAQGQDKARVEFPVVIEVTHPDEQLRPGMSVIVDIIVSRIDNVLTLPIEFIRKADREHFVTLADGTRRKIEAGMRDDDSLEIRSGLSEGDRVQMVDFASL